MPSDAAEALPTMVKDRAAARSKGKGRKIYEEAEGHVLSIQSGVVPGVSNPSNSHGADKDTGMLIITRKPPGALHQYCL